MLTMFACVPAVAGPDVVATTSIPADRSVARPIHPTDTQGPHTPTTAWTHLGRTPSHAGRVRIAGFANTVESHGIAQSRWSISTDDQGRSISFLPLNGLITAPGSSMKPGQAEGPDLVLALGYTTADTSNDRLYAFNSGDGSIAWSAPVPVAEFDSWSTPAVDVKNRAALVASGEHLTAIDLDTGSQRWSTALGELIVNASPVLTDDLGDADRAFITDFGFFSGSGRLICVNLDPFHPVHNPHQPGDIVWTVDLGAPTSGNTPAYHDGVVYVPIAGPFGGSGRVHAYPADAPSAPEPLWTFTDTAANNGATGIGFYGAATVTADAVYVAGYGFGFGPDQGRLVKLDRTTGSLQWAIAANRTDAAPIALPDGRILLSGGYEGGVGTVPTGSVPSIALFNDMVTHAVRAWDTADDTHQDFNANGIVDPGEPYLRLGGWTHHPAAVRDGNRWLLVAGVPAPIASGGLDAAHAAAVVIDLDSAPANPGFVIAERIGAGNSPAVETTTIYTLGPEGVTAINLQPGAAP